MKTRSYKGNYIGGHFIKVTDPNGAVYSRNPGDLDQEKVEFPFSYEHIHEAVLAAKRGFSVWKRQSPQERYAAIARYREVLSNRKETIAYFDAFEVGKPLWEAKREVEDTLSLIDHYLQLGSQTSIETKVTAAAPGVDGMIRYMPQGVIAVVTQSILPLISAHNHFIPALLNGNTVVVKTTKHAPALGQALAECAHEAGIPAGGFNYIVGDGEVARRLTANTELDGVFFTGTPETAVSIRKQLLAEYWKIQVVQSGGKNASIIWPDCQYERALKDSVYAAYVTSGQRYTTTNRIIVHEKIFDKFLKDFHALAKDCRVGYGLDEGEKSPFMGPLVSEGAIEDYVRYQGIAVREGCDEVMRGKLLEKDKKGYYVSPSIHVIEKADAKSVYQTAEFFGPNVALYKVRDIDEATEVTNLTQYGLVASIYTAARENYLRVVEDAQVGIVHWNYPTTHLSFKLPVGGLKKSGNLRPMGSFAGYQCTHSVSSLEAPVDQKANYWPKQMPGGEG